MRRIATYVLALALAGLSGCGQKGPLVRPGKHPASTPTPAGEPASSAAASTAAQ